MTDLPVAQPSMPPKRYKAFISYSHSADSPFAKRLQLALEKFAKPWNKVRACRIFRDQTNLAVAPDLWAEIEKALASSEHLLFLASPEATRSPWINRELQYWLDNEPASNLHIVKTGGEIVWDEQGLDFDWARTTCIPSALKGVFRQPPLYVDCSLLVASSSSQSTGSSSDREDFLDHVATIAARLHGKEKDQIFGEHIRQHRKTLRLAGLTLSILVCLAIALTFALTGEKHQATIAEYRARIAASQRLAAQARTLMSTERMPQAALLLAAESLKVTETAGEARAPAAEESLRAALAHVAGISIGTVTGIERSFLDFSPDGQRLGKKRDEKTVELWSLKDSDPSKALEIVAEQDLGSLLFTPDSKALVSIDKESVRIWPLDSKDLQKKPIVIEAGAPISAFVMSPDGRRLVVGQNDGSALMCPLNFTGTRGEPTRAHLHEGEILAVTISADGRFLITGSADKTAKVWDLTATDPWHSPVKILAGHSGGVSLIAVSKDGRRIITGGHQNTPRLWRFSTGASLPPLLLHKIEESIDWLDLSSDGRWLVSGGRWAYAALTDLTAADPSKSYTILPSYGGPVGFAVFSPDSKQILTAAGMPADELAEASTPEFVARVWDISSGPPFSATELQGHTDVISDAKFLNHGAYWATASFDGTIRIWDPKEPGPAKPSYVLRGHDGYVVRLATTKDGNWLATMSMDGTARLWPLADESVESSAPIRMSLKSPATLSASSDSRWLFAGDRYFVLWDLHRKRPSIGGQLLSLPDEMPVPANSAMSHNGRWLVTGFGNEKSKILLLWDLRQGLGRKEPILVDTEQRDIQSFTLTDNWLVVSLSHNAQDSGLEIWNLNTNPPERLDVPERKEPLTAYALSKDGTMLATADANDGLRLSVIGPERHSPDAVPLPPGGVIQDLEFTPANGWLIGRGFPKPNMVTLWKTNRDGRIVSPARELPAQSHELHIVTASPDERWLATGSFGEPLHVWRLDLGEFDHAWLTLPMHASISMTALFSANGRWLATTSYEGATQLWDLASAKNSVIRPIVLRGQRGPLVRLAFSPDSRWLISADTNLEPEEDTSKTCRIWDLKAPDPASSSIVLPSEKLPYGADKLDISTDGRWLITSSLDGVRLWPLGAQHLIEEAERAAGRHLTKEEERIYSLPVEP
jgi:WD40 repeat protein